MNVEKGVPFFHTPRILKNFSYIQKSLEEFPMRKLLRYPKEFRRVSNEKVVKIA